MTLKVTQEITRTGRATAMSLILGLVVVGIAVAIAAGPKEIATVATAGKQSTSSESTPAECSSGICAIIANPSAGGAIGCAKLNENALATGKATGRIFDLSDPDECTGKFTNGTTVVVAKRFQNAACVVPANALPDQLCMWIMDSEITKQSTPPVAAANTAKATQLLLPPPAPSATETNIQNLSIVAVYAATCKRNDPDYQPNGRFGSVIEYMFNQYTMAYMSQIRAATALSFDFVRDLGGAAKFCPIADQDASIQTAIKTIQAMAVR